jgi:hypothetical protein
VQAVHAHSEFEIDEVVVAGFVVPQFTGDNDGFFGYSLHKSKGNDAACIKQRIGNKERI